MAAAAPTIAKTSAGFGVIKTGAKKATVLPPAEDGAASGGAERAQRAAWSGRRVRPAL